jgi:uncharacterized protein (DUF58 family)
MADFTPVDSRVARHQHRLLDADAVSRISRLELQARHVVEGFLSGLHRSPYFGQSIEFVQHREYVPGDDVRRIDWKVWSKTDKFYIKLYEEETNLRTAILVDASESMQFGSRETTKFDYACSVTACLSYLLLRQADAVSCSTFDSELRYRVPSRSRQTHLNAILAALDVQSPARKTDIYGILRKVADEKSQKGMVILISDLFVPREGLFRGLKLLRKRGHDVLVFHVLDDQELDFEYSGTTRFEGLEEVGNLICDPRALRDGYLRAMTEFLDEVRRRCAQNVIDYHTIRTSEHLDAALRHYLSHRVGLRRSGRV